MKTEQANSSMEEQVQRQAEFPANGTSLNPLDEEWVFSGTQSTSVDQPASTE